MEYNQNEKELKYSHKPVTIDEVQTIMEQMKKYICKIKKKTEIGTGFFCYIPLEKKNPSFNNG